MSGARNMACSCFLIISRRPYCFKFLFFFFALSFSFILFIFWKGLLGKEALLSILIVNIF